MQNDIFEQARGAISPGLIKHLFDSPGSRETGGEWYILSPIRPDRTVGSFSINLMTGFWKDLKTDEGGDLISLIEQAHGVTPKEAAEMIVKESGGVIPDYRPVQDEELPPAVWPIPAEATGKLRDRIECDYALNNWGTPKNLYKYKSPLGEWMFSVVRFEKGEGKNTIPFYWMGGAWKSKMPRDLKPFFPYHIENVVTGVPIVITEGEKCANVVIEGFTVISWMGGTNRVQDTNWAVIADHDAPVYILPDADSARDRNGAMLPEAEQPGMKAAQYIASQIPGSVILPVYEKWPIADDPDGYDIADVVHEGGNSAECVHELIELGHERQKRLESVRKAEAQAEKIEHKEILKTKADPYAVYRAHIAHHYHGDCLEQNAGAYWEYRNDYHYWESKQKKDIICNFQRWMESTGLHAKVEKKQDAVKFFNKSKSYIETHSTGFIKENPFADAAVSPFIHVKNGAIEILSDGVKWHDRGEKGEKYFRDLYPVHCLDYPFNPKHLESVDIEKDAPAFWHFIKGLVPVAELDGLKEEEKQVLYMEAMRYVGQIFAYSLSPMKPNEYFFAIHGDQSTGKSFFIKLLKSIIGGKFCIERPIADMDNRFAASGFWGKKVFIEPDMKARAPLPDGFIKSYAGEQSITIERKNEQPIENVKISLAIFLISNYDFVVKGTEGILRRFIYLPYRNKLENPDRSLLDKILGVVPKGEESGAAAGKTWDERPAILGLALYCWRIFIMNNSEFDVPEWAQREKDRWQVENSSVASFVRDFMDEKSGTYRERRSVMYEAYKEWCHEEERRPLGKKNFFEEMRRMKGVSHGRNQDGHFFVIEKIEEYEDGGEALPF